MIPLKKPLSDIPTDPHPTPGQLPPAETEQLPVAEASQPEPAVDTSATAAEAVSPVAGLSTASRPTSRKTLVWIVGMVIFLGLAVGLYFLVGKEHNYWEDEAADADTETTEAYFEDF